MNENYTVYMHICPNNKKYIGITKNNVEKRWNHGRGYKNCILFYNAINKYKWENIIHKILHTNLSKKEASKKEIELIQKYKTFNSKFGYNICLGGIKGNIFSEETKIKISERTKEAMKNPIIREKLRQSRKNQESPMKGKKLSEEHKTKLVHNGMLGKKHSEKSKELMKKNITKKRKVICLETNMIYDSINEAARQTGIDYRNIYRSCNMGYQTKGLHWKYYNINKEEEN